MKSRLALVALAVALVPSTGVAAQNSLSPGQVERASTTWDGGAAVHPTSSTMSNSIYRGQQAAISRTGRFVVWEDTAPNLVQDDTNGLSDVFIRDRALGTTERVSVAADGAQADGPSSQASVSDDGRFVAFASSAKNLVAGSASNTFQVFVRDRVAATTELVSVATNGGPAAGFSNWPSISGDGRFVAFQSRANNLAPGDANGADFDVFVRDRDAGTTSYASVTSGGTPANDFADAPSISKDGRFVVFRSDATDIVAGSPSGRNIFVHDRVGGSTRNAHISAMGLAPGAFADMADVSDDGQVVAFGSNSWNLVPNDANNVADIFVHDFTTGQTTRVSVSSSGEEGNNYSWTPSLSGDGRMVAFMTWASNLFPGDANGQPDIVVHDRETGVTRLLSGTTEVQGAGIGTGMRDLLTEDGRLGVFLSTGTNLVPDTNHSSDVFVRDLGPVLGVGGLTLGRDGDRVEVAGWGSFLDSVETVFDDASNDATIGGAEAGAELTGLRVAYRPLEADIRFDFDVASLPSVRYSGRVVAGAPGVMYVAQFATAEVAGTFQVRGTRLDQGGGPGAQFGLYRCATPTTCQFLASARGGYGTTGNTISMTVRVQDLGLPSHSSHPGVPVSIAEGALLTGLRGFVVTGLPSVGFTGTPFDEVTGGSARIESRTLALGIAPEGTDPSSVVTDVPTVAAGAHRFTGSIDVAGRSGPHRVWARACFAGTCQVTSRGITL